MASDDDDQHHLVLLPQLPEEIIIFHVLTKLPTKSLLRFRAVCKSWNSATSHPLFLSLHRLLRPRSLSHILISASQPNSSHHHLLSTPISAAPRPLSPPTLLLSLPLPHSLSVKPANGLLLLHFPNDLYSDCADLPAFVFNPRTRDIISLPPNAPTNQKVKILYHLGYDMLGDEYKVLQIWRFIDTNLEMSESCMVFKVLSLGSGKWRRIRPCRIPFFCSSYGALFSPCCACNGGIHWVVHHKKFVLVFNLHDEEFSSIPFPQPFINNKVHIEEEHVVEVGTCLALLLKTSCSKNNMEMWVLKDYQNHKWVKEGSFRYDMSENGDVDFRHRHPLPLPLGSVSDGDEEILVFKSMEKKQGLGLGRLLCCDMKRRRFSGVDICGLSEWLSANDVRDCSFDAYEENIITLS